MGEAEGTTVPGEVRYSFDIQGHQLHVFLEELESELVAMLVTGELDLALAVEGPALVLLYRLRGRPIWCAAPYNWWLVREDRRLVPELPKAGERPSEAVPSGASGRREPSEAMQTLMLAIFDAASGHRAGLREIVLPDTFSAVLVRAIRAQVAHPVDREGYEKLLATLHTDGAAEALAEVGAVARCRCAALERQPEHTAAPEGTPTEAERSEQPQGAQRKRSEAEQSEQPTAEVAGGSEARQEALQPDGRPSAQETVRPRQVSDGGQRSGTERSGAEWSEQPKGTERSEAGSPPRSMAEAVPAPREAAQVLPDLSATEEERITLCRSLYAFYQRHLKGQVAPRELGLFTEFFRNECRRLGLPVPDWLEAVLAFIAPRQDSASQAARPATAPSGGATTQAPAGAPGAGAREVRGGAERAAEGDRVERPAEGRAAQAERGRVERAAEGRAAQAERGRGGLSGDYDQDAAQEQQALYVKVDVIEEGVFYVPLGGDEEERPESGRPGAEEQSAGTGTQPDRTGAAREALAGAHALREHAERLLGAAESAGDFTVTLAALREVRRCIELAARILYAHPDAGEATPSGGPGAGGVAPEEGLVRSPG